MQSLTYSHSEMSRHRHRNALEILLAMIVVSLSLLIACTEAYTGLIPADPERPGKCIYRGDELKEGENLVSPCQRLTCNPDGSMLIEGCGRLRIENCNRGERLNTKQPYPECCKLRYKCKKPDGTPYYTDMDLRSNTTKIANST